MKQPFSQCSCKSHQHREVAVPQAIDSQLRAAAVQLRQVGRQLGEHEFRWAHRIGGIAVRLPLEQPEAQGRAARTVFHERHYRGFLGRLHLVIGDPIEDKRPRAGPE